MIIYVKFKKILEEKNLWSLFTYLFFGGLATIVNIVSFYASYNYLNLSWPISNFISWIFSVMFAFVTNKLWVFHTRTPNMVGLFWEFSKFIIARIISLAMDMGCMYLLIDVLSTNNLIAKIITQIVVVVANYIFSKLFIFTDK